MNSGRNFLYVCTPSFKIQGTQLALTVSLVTELSYMYKSTSREGELKKVKSKSKLSPINGIIRDEKIFRAHHIYMQRKCRLKCVKDVTYV